MSEMFVDEWQAADRSERTALCFVVDRDFGFLQNFCKQLRQAGVDAVELLNSSRLAENVDDHNPDLVFVDVSPTNPSDCARALMSLKDCRYGGRVHSSDVASLRSWRASANSALTPCSTCCRPCRSRSISRRAQDHSAAEAQ